jgi:hypothetical protein
MRLVMEAIRIALIALALGCAEPTAISARPGAQAIADHEQRDNSYFVDTARGTVHIRLFRVRDQGDEPIHEFMGRAFATADAVGARRLVIDLRSIYGSDARLLVPLIKGIVARDRLAQRGGLYVVLGPDSFSPEQNAATLLQRYANPIFVHGE